MSSNAPTPQQLNIQKLMEELQLPKTDETHETYETLLKQEGKKLMAVLPPKIKDLKQQIASLKPTDEKIKEDQKKMVESLARDANIAKKNLERATKKRRAADAQYASTPKSLLVQEKIAIDKNEDGMLGEQRRSQTAKREATAALEAIATLEVNVAPDTKARLEDKAARETKAASQSFIPMHTLNQIYNRAENSTFANIENEDFKKLKSDVKVLVDIYKKESDTSVVSLTPDQYKAVSNLLGMQKKIIEAKIKKEEKKEKATKELPEEKNKVVNATVQDAAKQEEECEKVFTEANARLINAHTNFMKLPAVALPEQLKSHRKDLKDYQEKIPVNKAAIAANSRFRKIQQKNKLHQTVKAAVVKQIKESTKQIFDSSNTAALESAVEYCIAQLEQAPSAVQKALKKKCDKQPLTNKAVKISDILESTYHTYVSEGLKGLLSSTMILPELRKEAKAYEESRLVPPPPAEEPDSVPPPPEEPEFLKKPKKPDKTKKEATLLRVREAQQEGSTTPHNGMTFGFNLQQKAALSNKENTDKKESHPPFKPRG